jgi:autotransporter-associated beta strand protein
MAALAALLVAASVARAQTTGTVPETQPAKVQANQTGGSSLAAAPLTIVAGGSTVLSWNVPDSTSALTLSPGPGAWTRSAAAVVAPQAAQVQGTIGSVVVQPAVTTTYSLSGTTAAGAVRQSVTVTVAAPPGRSVLPTIFHFGATPPAVSAGAAVTLSWSTYGATRLVVSPEIGDVLRVSGTVNGVLNGKITVAPNTTTTYVLAATNDQGTATATATVTIGAQQVTHGSLKQADLGINASLNGALPFPAETSSPTSAAAATVINKDITRAPVDPMSNEIMAQLLHASGAAARLHTGFGFNYVVVGNSQPLVPIIYPKPGGHPGPWPVPPDTLVQQECVNLAQGPIFQIHSADLHMSVINRDSGTLYEGYFVFPPASGSPDLSWTIGSPTYPGSGQITNLATAMDTKQLVANTPGYAVNTGGSYIFPLLLRYDEASSGAIRHALWMCLGTARFGTTLNPCTSCIGPVPWPSNNASLVPNGGRARLKASYVIPSGISTEARAILQALKTYGGITIDGNSEFFPPGGDGYAWGLPGVEDMRWPGSLDAELAAAVKVHQDFEIVDMDPSLVIGAITTRWPVGNVTPVFGVNAQSQVTVNGVAQSDSNQRVISGRNAMGQVNVAVDIGPGSTPVKNLTLANPGFTIEGGTLAFSATAAIAANADACIYAVIAGNKGLLKIGSGALNACASNTYTGSTVIKGGTLQLQRAPGLPPTAVEIADGAALDISTAGNLTIGALAGSGKTTLGAKTLTVGGDNTTCSYAGFLSNSGGGSLVKTGAGKWTLTGASALYDNLTVDGGVLELAATANIHQGTGGWGNVKVNAGGTLLLHAWGWPNDAFKEMTANPSTIPINGGTLEMGPGATSGNRPFSIGADGATLKSGAGVSWEIGGGFDFVLVNNSGLTLTGSGNGVLAPPITGTGSLAMTGSGTWTLNGLNTYSGATTVSAGKLVVTGTLANTSAVTIAARATVEVTGKLSPTGNLINHGTLVLSGDAQIGAGGTITNHGTIINNSPTLKLPAIINHGTITGGAAKPGGTGATRQ